MKKILALILALCMVLALCACGGTPASTAASAAPSAAATKGADTNTVAVGAVIIARDDVPTDEIYTFVKTIFDNKDTIAQQHGKGAELNLDFASSITSVPYHPGAAKYFEEQGKKVASVKEGAGTGAASALMFGTGGESGTYYAFGGVLASYVTGNSDVSVTAVTSDGSKANIEDLAAGDVQIAFAQSDVLSYAYNGERLFTSPVKGFSDLKGKTVSIGAAGSGVYFNAIDVLQAYGMTEKDITPVYQSFADSADSLKDGKIDAAFIVAGAPTTAITDLATSGSVYLVSLDDTHVQSLLSSSPYYSAYTIPAGTY